MTPRFVVFLLVIGCLGGCADETDSSVSTAGEVTSAPDSSSPPLQQEEPPVPDVRPGVSLDRLVNPRTDDSAVLAQLQPPRTVRAEPTPNRHVQGQTDTVRTYVYDGLEIEAYEISGGSYGTASGLSVGEAREQIESVLGIPFQEDGNVAAYTTGDEPTPMTVEVEYETDAEGTERATAISWIPYLD